MEQPFIIQEHMPLPDWFKANELRHEYAQYNGFCLNPEASDFDKRYFFTWDKYRDTYLYRATYIIGAQWLNSEQPLVVTTEKVNNIDFLEMFSVCLSSGLNADSFSKIYDIDMSQPTIKTNVLDCVLSPLIVTHFLSVVQTIATKGLKKDYVYQESNLKKAKGKIGIKNNERINIISKRYDRIYCRYQEYTENTPENRIIKKALCFAECIIHKMFNHNKYSAMYHTLQQCKAVFTNVNNDIELKEIHGLKPNKLFKEYKEAIRLAKLILNRYDFSITKTGKSIDFTPVFWLDMPLLFEHYVLGLLRQAYGDNILYQKPKGKTGIPDFLHIKQQLILDTKYIPRIANDDIDINIIRQLSAYSRDSLILEKLGIDDKHIVPCILIYPANNYKDTVKFNRNDSIITYSHEVKNLIKFYKIGIALPTINQR